ncbi:hypothetical protein ACFQ0B_58210 [Nonomuraea thailandensis]
MTVAELDVSRGRAAARVGSGAWLLLAGWPLWSFLGGGLSRRRWWRRWGWWRCSRPAGW